MKSGVAAIILAAGESRRMGTPKALLAIRGKSFLRHIVDVYQASKVENIIVVGRPDAAEIEKELHGLEVAIAVNKNPDAGQLSSVVVGLNAARSLKAAAILMHPVDHPDVSVGSVRKILDKFHQVQASIVVPTCRGTRGHPVLFSARLFDELEHAPPDIGVRAVVWAHQMEVVEVETGDRGVIRDIDTTEDYEDLRRNL